HAEPELLFLVEVFLDDRHRIVEADRPERRGPLNTGTYGCPNGGIRADHAGGVGDLVAIKRTGICEECGAKAEIFREGRHREGHFSRSGEIGRAADRVAIRHARTDTIVLETTDLTATDHELVENVQGIARSD